MPQLGETVAEGKIGTWFKSVGDAVAPGDNLFEVETDKVTMEVQATTGGVLSEIRVAAGQTVSVGTVVAVLGDAAARNGGSDATGRGTGDASRQSAPMAAATATAAAKPNGAARANGTPHIMSPFEEVRTPSEGFGPVKGPLGLRITPLARRLMRQGGFDVEAVAQAVRERGGRRIAAADVKQAKARPAASGASEAEASRPAIEPRAGNTIEPLNRIRAQTATRLAEAWRAAPHVFQAVEIDFSWIDRARQAAKRAFADRHGITLTYLPFIARAVCLAIAEFPRINASFDKDHLVLHRDVNLGIAVDLAHAGLVVPVLHHADELTVGGLAKAIARQVEKARAGKLALADIEGGTYSISNNGSFGTLFTTPIINVPQVAILSTDAVRKRPVVVETEHGDVVLPRPVGMVGQSFDHRAFDGGYSAAFLKRLKEIAETRDWSAEFA
jgi:2-oxoglutarate dehydrogenase E2 component (dihydrolipoamide succinyltransferase)